MISVQVVTRGIPASIARSVRRHERLIAAMYEATDEGVDLTVDLVRRFSPVMTVNRGGSTRYPGELRESVRGEVLIRESGRVLGRVSTDVEWAPFVEHGTREHGRARHMFALGRRTARPLITALFDAHIARAIQT